MINHVRLVVALVLAAVVASCSSETNPLKLSSPSALEPPASGPSTTSHQPNNSVPVVVLMRLSDLPAAGNPANSCPGDAVGPTLANTNNGKVDLDWERRVNVRDYEVLIRERESTRARWTRFTQPPAVASDLTPGNYVLTVRTRLQPWCGNGDLRGGWSAPFYFSVDDVKPQAPPVPPAPPAPPKDW